MSFIPVPGSAEWVDNYKFIELNTGIRMAYMEFGDTEKPPLIMVHGFSDTARLGRLTAIKLAEDYHIYAVDLRGHGLSDKPKRFAYTILQHAEDITDFIDQMGIDRFYLVGQSMGGMISQIIAFTIPDRVIKLALVSTGARFHHSPEELRELNETFSEYSSKTPALEDWYSEAKYIEDKDFYKPHYAELKKWPEYCWKAAWWGMELQDNTPFLQYITAPTIAFWGTADPIFTEKYQKEVQKLLPIAKYIFFEEQEHDLMSLVPDELGRYIKAFFA